MRSDFVDRSRDVSSAVTAQPLNGPLENGIGVLLCAGIAGFHLLPETYM